ncbi:MAG: hypothetical protein IJ317_04360, partial [Clostridia bacterium]|nr:hypothetical protein [Clostridia bacterium]
IFDEKENIFVRFWNWITRKPKKTALETLAANEKELLPQIENYQNAQLDETTATDGDTPTGGDKGGEDGFDGFVVPNE